MNPKDLIGSFTLRNEGQGCFTSKYHHNKIQACFTEACKKVRTGTDNKDEFVGNFRTCWLQETVNHRPEFTFSIRSNGENYLLKWTEDGKIIFEGTAMLFEGKLIGAYWNC